MHRMESVLSDLHMLDEIMSNASECAFGKINLMKSFRDLHNTIYNF